MPYEPIWAGGRVERPVLDVWGHEVWKSVANEITNNASMAISPSSAQLTAQPCGSARVHLLLGQKVVDPICTRPGKGLQQSEAGLGPGLRGTNSKS